MVVCNEEHRFMVAEQLRQLNVEAVSAHPRTRRAQHRPAVALAALQAVAADPEAIMLVLPADHVIRDVDAFVAAVATGPAPGA